MIYAYLCSWMLNKHGLFMICLIQHFLWNLNGSLLAYAPNYLSLNCIKQLRVRLRGTRYKRDRLAQMTFSNNSRRDINRTHFGLGFFTFPNWSCKTTPAAKKSLQKGQCKGQLLGPKIEEFAASKKILYIQLMDRQNLSLPISLQILVLSLPSLWNNIVWIHTFSRNR